MALLSAMAYEKILTPLLNSPTSWQAWRKYRCRIVDLLMLTASVAGALLGWKHLLFVFIGGSRA
jgi:hypothetical protein